MLSLLPWLSYPFVLEILCSLIVVTVYIVFSTGAIDHKVLDEFTNKLLHEAPKGSLECERTISQLVACPCLDEESGCAEQLRRIIKSFSLPYISLATKPELLLSLSTLGTMIQFYVAPHYMTMSCNDLLHSW